MESRGVALSLLAAAAIAGGGSTSCFDKGLPSSDGSATETACRYLRLLKRRHRLPCIACVRPSDLPMRVKGQGTYANSPCEGGKLVDATPTRGYESPHSSPPSKKGTAPPGQSHRLRKLRQKGLHMPASASDLRTRLHGLTPKRGKAEQSRGWRN